MKNPAIDLSIVPHHDLLAKVLNAVKIELTKRVTDSEHTDSKYVMFLCIDTRSTYAAHVTGTSWGNIPDAGFNDMMTGFRKAIDASLDPAPLGFSGQLYIIDGFGLSGWHAVAEIMSDESASLEDRTRHARAMGTGLLSSLDSFAEVFGLTTKEAAVKCNQQRLDWVNEMLAQLAG